MNEPSGMDANKVSAPAGVDENNRLEEYYLDKELGRGSFAKVYLAIHESTRESRAVKKIDRGRLSSKLLQNLEQEIGILRDFQHGNIVKLFGIKKTKAHIFLVLEFCAGGDLQKFIRSQGRLSEAVAQHFMRHLADGLVFLWQHELVHRDIKPQNLLLTANAPTATLKIADFGFARHLGAAAMADTLCGSPLYMAPEILTFQRYDGKADLWSAGTVLFEMLAGKPPYGGANQSELVENIRTQEIRLPAGVRIGRACVDLLQMLLQRKPHKRASFERVMAADFLRHAPATATTSTTAATATATTATTPASPAAAVAAAVAANHNSSSLKDAGLGSIPLVACSPPTSSAGGSRARALSSPAHMHCGGGAPASGANGDGSGGANGDGSGGAASALSPTSELVSACAVRSQLPPPPQGPSNLAVQLHKANVTNATGAATAATAGNRSGDSSGLQTQLVARLPRRSSSGDSMDSAGSGGGERGQQYPFPPHHSGGGTSPYGSPGFASCNVLAPTHANSGHPPVAAGYLSSGGGHGGPLTLQSVHHSGGNARSSSGTSPGTAAAHPQASYLAGYRHPNPVPSNHYLQQPPYQTYPNSNLPLQQFPFPSMPLQQYHHHHHHHPAHAERHPPQVFAQPLTASPPQKASAGGGVAGYLQERRRTLDACYHEQDTILQRLAPSTTPPSNLPTSTAATAATSTPPLIAASRSPPSATTSFHQQRVESLERGSSRGGPPPTLGTVAEGGTEGSDEWFVVDAVDGTCGDVVSASSDRYAGAGTSSAAAAAAARAQEEAIGASTSPSHQAFGNPTSNRSAEDDPAIDTEPWLLAEPAATILERVHFALGSIELLGRCAMAVARVGDAAAALVLSGSSSASLESTGGSGGHASIGSGSGGPQLRERSRARAFSAPSTLVLSDAPSDVSSDYYHAASSSDARSPPSTLSPASTGFLPPALESGSNGGSYGGGDGNVTTTTTAAMAIPQGNDYSHDHHGSSSQGSRNNSYEAYSPNGLLLRRAGESPVSDQCGSPGDALHSGGLSARRSSGGSSGAGGAHVGPLPSPFMGGSVPSPQHRSSAHNEHLSDALLLYLKAMSLVKRAVELGRALACDARQRPPPVAIPQQPQSLPNTLHEAPLTGGLAHESGEADQQAGSAAHIWDVASAAVEAEAVARAEQLEAWLASQYALLLGRAEQCRHSVNLMSPGASPHAAPPSPLHGSSSSTSSSTTTTTTKAASHLTPASNGDAATAVVTTAAAATSATIATVSSPSSAGAKTSSSGSSGSSGGSSLRRAEQRVYRAALQAARAAAVKEVLGAPELAMKLYQHGQYLVESLLLEPQLPQHDRQVLAGYDSSFQQRIDALDRILRPELYQAPEVPDEAPLASDAEPSSSPAAGAAGEAAAGRALDEFGGGDGGDAPTSPLSQSPHPAAPGSPHSAKSSGGSGGSGNGSGNGVSEHMDTLADLLAVPPPSGADSSGYGSSQLNDLCVPPPLAMLTAPRGLASPHRRYGGEFHDYNAASSSNNPNSSGGNGGGQGGAFSASHGHVAHHTDDFAGGAVGFLGNSSGDFGNGDAAFM